MKGMVFTEFMDLVEETWGLDMSEDLLDTVQPASGGIYTAVGNYDAGELVALALCLSEKSNTPLPDLLRTFGHRIFQMFTQQYGHFFAECDNALSFLAGIHGHIHVEVRKLYPDAELPNFDYPDEGANQLVMDYESTRPLSEFAHGLILATVAHYGEPIEVRMEDLSGGQGNRARFTLTRQAA